MFEKMKLSHQIGGGFGVVLIIFSIAMAFSVSGFYTAENGFKEYRGHAQNTKVSGELQAKMLQARISVKDFLIENQEKDAEKFNASIAEVNRLLNEMSNSDKRPAISSYNN